MCVCELSPARTAVSTARTTCRQLQSRCAKPLPQQLSCLLKAVKTHQQAHLPGPGPANSDQMIAHGARHWLVTTPYVPHCKIDISLGWHAKRASDQAHCSDTSHSRQAEALACSSVQPPSRQLRAAAGVHSAVSPGPANTSLSISISRSSLISSGLQMVRGGCEDMQSSQ